MTNSILSSNSAEFGGGGIEGSSVTVTNSTLVSNSAQYGGGIYAEGSVTVTNSTLVSNSAQVRGGGIFANYSLTVTNSTLASNSGGGISVNPFYGSMTVSNSILWGNSGEQIDAGTLNYSDVQGGWAGTGNINVDPLLAALGNYGGPTQTMALLPGSPAIDAGSNAAATATDQRGFQRIVNGTIDIGAFEVQVTSTAPGNQAGTEGAAASFNLGSFADANSQASSWVVDLAWGDGSSDTVLTKTAQGALGSATHTFAEQGAYTVTVTVSDTNGDSSEASFKVTVADAPLTAGSLTPPIGSPTGSTYANGFNGPQSVAFDSNGNLYVANTVTGIISKVTSAGVNTTFASGLAYPVAIAFDASGNLYAANYNDNSISKITPAGSVSTFASGGLISIPEGIAIDSAGNVFIGNRGADSILKITPAGAVSTFLSGGALSGPNGLAFDGSGNLYVANNGASNVLKVTPAGSVSVLASVSTGVWDLTVDGAGNVYVVPGNWSGYNVISKITPAGSVSTLISNNGLNGAIGITQDSSGNLYAANYTDGTIAKVTLAQAVEGLPFSNLAVFHFTDADPASTVSDYTATVNTGDATLTSSANPSNVRIVANSGGGFDVILSYTYAEALSNQAFSVTVTDVGGVSTSASTSTLNVADASLSATGSAVAAIQGAAFNNVPVGTLTDAAGTYSNPSDLSATINWGDGTATSTATLVEVGTTGVYTVEGSHTYTVYGSDTISVSYTDQGGSTTTSSSTATVADETPPTVSLTTPANNSFTNNTQPTLTATAADNSGGSGLASVQFQYSSNGGSTWTNAGAAETSGPFSYTFSSSLADGAYQARAIATDNVGNSTTSAAVTFTVDTQAPRASITSEPPPITNSTSTSFTFTGADPTSGGVSSGLSYLETSLDGGSFAPATSPDNLTGLSQGSHTFQVLAVDNAGNIGTAVSYTWIVDQYTPPVAGNASYNVSKNNPLVVAAPGLLAYDSDAASGPLTIALVSAPIDGTVAINPNGSFTYTPNTGFVGTDAFTYQANDGIANSNVATVNLTVSNTAPVAVDDGPYVVHKNVPLTVNAASGVLSNATDANGDTLSALTVRRPIQRMVR